MISGHCDQIMKLNTCVMEKVRDPGFIVDDTARTEIVKIVLTDESAGLLIGPKGKITLLKYRLFDMYVHLLICVWKRDY